MTTSQQDMRAEFKKQFPIPKYINRLMVRHNYALASAGWDAAWQHRQQELDALQAKLDAVMLEYCPEEMTQEQTEKWAISQVVSDNSELDAARLEVDRLYTAIKKITKLNAIDAGIYTTGKIDAICKEALAAQQEAG